MDNRTNMRVGVTNSGFIDNDKLLQRIQVTVDKMKVTDVVWNIVQRLEDKKALMLACPLRS